MFIFLPFLLWFQWKDTTTKTSKHVGYEQYFVSNLPFERSYCQLRSVKSPLLILKLSPLKLQVTKNHGWIITMKTWHTLQKITPLKTNMEPKQGPVGKGWRHLQTINFWVPAVSLPECTIYKPHTMPPRNPPVPNTPEASPLLTAAWRNLSGERPLGEAGEATRPQVQLDAKSWWFFTNPSEKICFLVKLDHLFRVKGWKRKKNIGNLYLWSSPPRKSEVKQKCLGCPANKPSWQYFCNDFFRKARKSGAVRKGPLPVRIS